MPIQDDEVMAEIRRYRDEFAARFNGDLHRMAEYLRQREREGEHMVVTRPPKRLELVEPRPKA